MVRCTAFILSLESRGWTADTQLEHPSHLLGPSLEEFSGTPEEKDEHIGQQLKAVSAEKKVLILRNSHMGGHKFAGNCIVGFYIIMISPKAYHNCTDLHTTRFERVVRPCYSSRSGVHRHQHHPRRPSPSPASARRPQYFTARMSKSARLVDADHKLFFVIYLFVN